MLKNKFLLVLAFISTFFVSIHCLPLNSRSSFQYDSNSIPQNEKVLQLFLRLASRTASKLLSLKQKNLEEQLNRLNEDKEFVETKNSESEINDMIKYILNGRNYEKSFSDESSPDSESDSGDVEVHSRLLSDLDQENSDIQGQIKKLSQDVKPDVDPRFAYSTLNNQNFKPNILIKPRIFSGGVESIIPRYLINNIPIVRSLLPQTSFQGTKNEIKLPVEKLIKNDDLPSEVSHEKNDPDDASSTEKNSDNFIDIQSKLPMNDEIDNKKHSDTNSNESDKNSETSVPKLQILTDQMMRSLEQIREEMNDLKKSSETLSEKTSALPVNNDDHLEGSGSKLENEDIKLSDTTELADNNNPISDAN